MCTDIGAHHVSAPRFSPAPTPRLVEIAPHYYSRKDIQDEGGKKIRTKGKSAMVEG